MDCATQKKAYGGFAICLLVVMAWQLGCAAVKTSRVLMPTPIALTLGAPYPGGDFRDTCQCGDEPVPVFVVSGRNVEQADRQPHPYGNERSPIPTMGIAQVRVGAGLSAEDFRKETTTETRRKRAKIVFDQFELAETELHPDPWRGEEKVIQHKSNRWIEAVNAQLDRSEKRNVTIYVHGYNTELVENTLLAGEIFHYLGRQGAMISFDWPSESRLLRYIADTGNANFSTRHFRAIVSNIAKDCNVDSITIIAHSAGSPIVVNALREIRLIEFNTPAPELRTKYRINRVVLAAPDMDVMAFVNAIHDRFYELTGGVAIYASPKDRALGVSEKLYGNLRLGRAVGKLEPWEKKIFQRVPEIEVIDASMAEKLYRNFLGHSYFHRDPFVSSDIGAFVLGNSPAERQLVKTNQGQVFWEFPDDYRQRLARRYANQTAVSPN